MRTTHPFDDDHLREECAIFRYGSGDAAAHAALDYTPFNIVQKRWYRCPGNGRFMRTVS